MKKIFISIIVLLLLSSAVYAQRGMGGGFGKHMKMQEKNLDNLRLIKLLDLLELTDEQNDKFIAAYSSIRIEKRKMHEKMQAEVEILSEQINAESPNESLIKNQIDKVEALMEQKMQSIRKFHEKIKDNLTVVQMGKMVIFENRFERELLETVRDFRKKHMMQMQEDAPAMLNDTTIPDGRH